MMKLAFFLALCLLLAHALGFHPIKSIKQSIKQSNSRDTNVTVTVDWKSVIKQSKTEVSFQIVVNPMIMSESPIRKQVYESVKRLDAVKHARYAAWFPYPKLSVPALNAPSGLNQCSNVANGYSAKLSCTKGPGPKGTIASIDAVFFGSPAGVCQSFNSSCFAKNATEIVTKLCLGKSECEIPASTDLFGDPNCSGGVGSYRLAVQIQCNPPRNHTYWDFDNLEDTTVPFFEATEGRKPILSLCTTPNWLWTQQGGPQVHYYPDNPNSVDYGYNVGNELVDPSCNAIGQYYGRVISWYTQGGFTDEYGDFHRSSHKIDPSTFLVEILNEPGAEHSISPELYICIYDAAQQWIREWADPEHKLEFVGMALDNEDNLDYFSKFLNLSNHATGTTLDWISYHRYASSSTRTNITAWETDFFDNYDTFFTTIANIQKIRSTLSPTTKTDLDEVGVILPNDNDPNAPLFPDIYFNAVSALYAYMVGRVTNLDVEIVGASQLVGYPQLDILGGLDPQVPSVTMLNWTTGAGTARYWTVDLLSRAFTNGDQLVSTNSSSDSVYALGFLGGSQQKMRRMLVVNKLSIDVVVTIPNTKGSFWRIVDPSTGDNPPKRIKSSSDTITIEPWTVAIINLDENFDQNEEHVAYE